MSQSRGIAAAFLPAFVLGAFVCAGLIGLGYWATRGALEVKGLERSVTVKGLAEREVPADIAIWPIRFTDADNDLVPLYDTVQRHNALVLKFLAKQGFSEQEISVAPPSMVDRQAQGYGNPSQIPFRYAATSTITVYTQNVEQVRKAMTHLVDLGKEGIAISGEDMGAGAQFLFTHLNDLKPGMIEAATRNAREVADKFAADSDSHLGKIRRASQGQFSIEDRDSNTPYIKKVRVVSTVDYYLSD
ncbi:MAG: SIMPL domain-containing protein [Thiohalocapsa sp.]|uniref:SIMPL domain-containing protein n=1 Tax=Thiohalocapsa sp. TaxID=2497641 RepID=UPI0025EECAA8|nr:SIMPL domain-containing protein [Thiohalocapsa sp.]MCG6942133.1 SIMPL domain-containing protein [Thiohalocapsa sp.]